MFGNQISTITSFKDIFDELVLPEWLNRKEELFAFLQDEKGDKNHLMETCRRFQSLYEVICYARFNLALSCKIEYPELLDPDNSQLSHVWMRSQFLNNAILWYNVAFDLILQPLWIYYKIYAKTKAHLSLTSENLDNILKTCNYNSLINNGAEELGKTLVQKLDNLNSYMQDNVRLWANTLKHRQKIEYNELSKNKHLIAIGGTFSIREDEDGKLMINVNEGGYNSSKTIKYVDMTKVISILISFHKEIVTVSMIMDKQIFGSTSDEL